MGILKKKASVQSITSLGSKASTKTPIATKAKNLAGKAAGKMTRRAAADQGVADYQKSNATFNNNFAGAGLHVTGLSPRQFKKVQKRVNKNYDKAGM